MDTFNNLENPLLTIQSLSGCSLECHNLYGDICHIKDKSDVELCITTQEFAIIISDGIRIVITLDDKETLLYRGSDQENRRWGISWNSNPKNPYIVIFCHDKDDKLIAHFTLSHKSE